MNKRSGFLKIFLVILCLFFVSVFALIESGETPAFVTAYKNNFKRNISGICGFLNINHSIDIFQRDCNEFRGKGDGIG